MSIKWTLNVNSEVINDFYNVCHYLHKAEKRNCFYNYSSAFQYILKDMVDNKHNDIRKYHKKIKKDLEIGICVDQWYYEPFLELCNRYKINRNNCIRALMLKLIEENKYKLNRVEQE